MDVVIRLGVRIEMHWPLFSIGTLQLNCSPDDETRLIVHRYVVRHHVFNLKLRFSTTKYTVT